MNYWKYIVTCLFAVLVGMMPALQSLAGELHLELGVGYDRHKRDEAPQSVIRFRYEHDTPWWAPDVVEIDHHSSIEKTSGEKLVDQASVIWRFRIF